MKIAQHLANYTNIDNRLIGTIKIVDLVNYDIVIPEIQRIIDSDKTKIIVDYQIDFHKKYKHFNFLGCINIHYCVSNETYYLVDGQHRFTAAKNLYDKMGYNVELVIEVVQVETIDELKNNYEIINKNTPLPVFDPDIDKHIPEQAAVYFQNKYKNIWSKNSRSRKPHIYFNYFQEALGDITKHLEITSSQSLIQLVEERNKKYAGWSCDKFKIGSKVKDKCDKEKFYLGLFKYDNEESCCYKWVREIIHEETGKDIKLITNIKRKKHIPKKIKNDSWNKYVGITIGETNCYCCNTSKIHQSDFTAGHIISENNGGECTPDNILPICAPCNASMGTMNMEDFINAHYSQNVDRFNNRNNISNPGKNSGVWSLFNYTL
jgi:hypothetical protein